MLAARKAPRACLSCRLPLLALFTHSFPNPPVDTCPTRLRPSSRPPPSILGARHARTSRRFATTAATRQGSQLPNPIDSEPQPAPTPTAGEDTESIVRQARRTFGDTLPADYLSPNEYTLYERLYGPPLRETRPEDLEYVPDGEEENGGPERPRHVLSREKEDGEFEEIDFAGELGVSIVGEEAVLSGESCKLAADAENQMFETVAVGSELAAEIELPRHLQSKDKREADAIARLRRDMEDALAVQALLDENTAQEAQRESNLDEDFEDAIIEETEKHEEEDDREDVLDDWGEADIVRTHPHTVAGRYGTNSGTLSLPNRQFIEPIAELLTRTHIKHLTEAAENSLGGKGLPYSTSTPASKKTLPQKEVALDASQHRMGELEADVYLAAVMPGTYAAVFSTLVEVRKRLGAQWLQDLMFRDGGEGARVLDAGAGGGGVVAWRELVQAEWDILKDDGVVGGEEAPHGKSTVLTGSNSLRHRVSRFIDNTTFLPRLPEYVPTSDRPKEDLENEEIQRRKVYDIIIAPHSLLPLKEEYRRKKVVQTLWSLLDPKGGVLILIEKGLPRGFEAIAGARALLLDSNISSPGRTQVEMDIDSSSDIDGGRYKEKEPGMIIAPCTNHAKCPMYPVPGLSSGRKDYCHFNQRFFRPEFLQRILGATSRNHEDVKFSYVAIRRGVDDRKGERRILQGEQATSKSFEGYEDFLETGDQSEISFNPLSLPRTILPPLKRRGHVTLDLCTPSGTLERWTVPKSFSKIAYRDARKSKWGDLWALGAKTRVTRSPRLGRLGQETTKGIRSTGSGIGQKKGKKNRFDMVMGEEGLERIEESKSTKKVFRPQKRTKHGRVLKEDKPITEEDLG